MIMNKYESWKSVEDELTGKLRDNLHKMLVKIGFFAAFDLQQVEMDKLREKIDKLESFHGVHINENGMHEINKDLPI
jgi:hypothetical protein